MLFLFNPSHSQVTLLSPVKGDKEEPRAVGSQDMMLLKHIPSTASTVDGGTERLTKALFNTPSSERAIIQMLSSEH